MATFNTTGTITVTNGSAAVTGAGTNWLAAGIASGTLYVAGAAYPISEIHSNTSLTLAINYAGTSGGGKAYAIAVEQAVLEQTASNANRIATILDGLAPLAGYTSFSNGLMANTNAGAWRTGLVLGNVNNTSDANKPVSSAQLAALNLKANQSTTYTKTETDAALALKADLALLDVVTRSGADPSLDLDLSVPGNLPGTFTRASTGTYFDASGTMKTAAINAPRYDHDPATGERLGLLIEREATNIFLRSQEFDTANWTKVNATNIADATVAPDGTTTADKIVEDSSTNSDHYTVSSSVTISGSTTYTISMWLKKAERHWVRFRFGTNVGYVGEAYFDLENRAVGFVSANVTAQIVDVTSSGWVRCALTGTTQSGATGIGHTGLYLATGSQAAIYTGDGTSGLYVWGAQLETGPYASSYIATTSSAVSRAADGNLISDATPYAKSEALTLYAEISSKEITENQYIIDFGSGTTSAIRAIRIFNGAAYSTVYDSGVIQNNLSVAISKDQYFKAAATFKKDNFSLSVNGGALVKNAIGSLPPITRLTIGYGYAAASAKACHIKRIVAWSQVLTDATLVEISS